MKSLFPPEWTPEQRIEALQGQADNVTVGTWYQQLTAEELADRHQQLAENVIALSKLEEKKKAVMKEIKEEIKPISEENSQLLTEIDSRHAQKSGKLFAIFDHDRGMAEVYDANGDLVNERRLLPEEKQSNIFSMRKAN